MWAEQKVREYDDSLTIISNDFIRFIYKINEWQYSRFELVRIWVKRHTLMHTLMHTFRLLADSSDQYGKN